MVVLFLVPELPTGKSLQQEHLQAVLHIGSSRCSFLHEEGLVGIVDEVIEDGVAVHRVIGQHRTGLGLGIHAHRGAVDDHIIFFDDIRGDALILYRVGALVSADKHGLKSKVMQPVVHGLRRSSCTEDKGFLMPFLVEHGFYTLRESYHV